MKTRRFWFLNPGFRGFAISGSELGSCRAGMAWKTAKSRKMEKKGKRPRAGQEQKWRFPFRFPFFPAFDRFPCHTSPAGSQDQSVSDLPEKGLAFGEVKGTFGEVGEIRGSPWTCEVTNLLQAPEPRKINTSKKYDLDRNF